MDLDEKIARLKPFDNKDKQLVNSIRDQAIDMQLQMDFIGHPRTKELVEEYTQEKQGIDSTLLNDEDLMVNPARQLERIQLASRSATLKRIILDMTLDPSGKLESLEKQVDEMVARSK